MHGTCTPNVISVASVLAPKLDIYAIQNGDKILHVFDAHLIRLLSDIFQVPYRIYLPQDGEFGRKLPDGNWSGRMGMVIRSEADLALGGTSLSEEKFIAVNFSYPHLFSDFTFMTDKLRPVSRNLALLKPFSINLWIALITAIFFFSFLIFFMTNKTRTYPYILSMTYGTILGISFSIKSQKTSHRLLICAWLFFSFVIMNSYKTIFLSFIVLPNFTGIRNIPDLIQASTRNLVTCYSYDNEYFSQIFLQSGIDSWKSIGKCLQRNHPKYYGAVESFVKAPQGKVFIASRIYLKAYKKNYFLSEDSFFNAMYALPISRNFTCKITYLNKMIHCLIAAGIFDKLYKDKAMKLQLKSLNSESNVSDAIIALQIRDLKGAFLVLIFGYFISSIVLFMEITVNYYFPYKRQF